MSKERNCNTIRFRWGKLQEEATKTIYEYNSLPARAKDDSLEPVSEKAKADRAQALQLERQLGFLARTKLDLIDKLKECESTPYTP